MPSPWVEPLLFENKYFCIFVQYINPETQNHKLMNASSGELFFVQLLCSSARAATPKGSPMLDGLCVILEVIKATGENYENVA